MNRNKKGFISLLLLAVGLLVTALAILLMNFIFRNARQESIYARDWQVRNYAYLAMGALVDADPDGAVNEEESVTLYPGAVTALLKKKVTFSTDNNFRTVRAEVLCGEERFGLCQYRFTPSTAVQNRAGSYILSSCFAISNIKYANGATNSKNTYFNTPAYDEDYCMSLDVDEIKKFGFGRYVYFYNGNLTLPKKNYTGDAVVIVRGNLTVTAGATFAGRMIFLTVNNAANGAIGAVTLENNVRMADAMILSTAALTIGSGCNLTGHFRSNGSVILKGYANFYGRSDAGRGFTGMVFVQ